MKQIKKIRTLSTIATHVYVANNNMLSALKAIKRLQDTQEEKNRIYEITQDLSKFQTKLAEFLDHQRKEDKEMIIDLSLKN